MSIPCWLIASFIPSHCPWRWRYHLFAKRHWSIYPPQIHLMTHLVTSPPKNKSATVSFLKTNCQSIYILIYLPFRWLFPTILRRFWWQIDSFIGPIIHKVFCITVITAKECWEEMCQTAGNICSCLSIPIHEFLSSLEFRRRTFGRLVGRSRWRGGGPLGKNKWGRQVNGVWGHGEG